MTAPSSEHEQKAFFDAVLDDPIVQTMQHGPGDYLTVLRVAERIHYERLQSVAGDYRWLCEWFQRIQVRHNGTALWSEPIMIGPRKTTIPALRGYPSVDALVKAERAKHQQEQTA